MKEQEKVVDQICPDCSQMAMDMDNNQIMVCKKCGSKIPLDIYMMSLEIIEKQLVIQTLRSFLQAGTGKCVAYNEQYYIVGFDQDYQLITQKYELGQNEKQGMYVRIQTSEGEKE